ncbi:isoprenoid synthase domain-containing protein [Hypoxylon argillaceum]|nr:isoprenoid synthase domain-containing protein [Hypoxylon argillaceum]
MPGTKDEIKHELKPLLVKFEKEMGYTSAQGTRDHAALLDGMHLEATRIGIPYPENSHAWHAFHAGSNYAYLCYPNLPLEVRVYTGIFTWIAIIVDDYAKKDPEEWHQFIPRFLTGAKHHNEVAREWERCLRLAYQHYEPVAANFFITAALNFTNACALEGSELPKLTPTAGGENFAYYLRDKNGVAEAYAWMNFPKAIFPDVSCYLEAVPDITKYICFANDIMSFYKEESVGETDNYMHIRATYENVDVYDVFRQVIEETVDAHRRIKLVLEGKDPYAQLWQDHALGFVSFHTTSDRYKLRDLCLNESLP